MGKSLLVLLVEKLLLDYELVKAHNMNDMENHDYVERWVAIHGEKRPCQA